MQSIGQDWPFCNWGKRADGKLLCLLLLRQVFGVPVAEFPDQDSQRCAPNQGDGEPFQDLFKDQIAWFEPVLVPEPIIFGAKDVQIFREWQFAEGKQCGVIGLITEDGRTPSEHAGIGRAFDVGRYAALDDDDGDDRYEPDAEVEQG
jgi:hypothetical protein